jgi:glycosyltransferase involved in cell wall biosynthesis
MIIGGAQENTLFNCRDLVELFGDEVLLITGPATGPEGDLLEQARVGGVRIKVLPDLQRAIHPYRDWRALKQIQQAITDFSPEVVHTHSAKGGMLGRAAAWRLKIPAVIHTVHGAPFHPYQSVLARSVFRRCEKYAARRCHAMISVADAMTDLMVDAHVAPREKFTTIYSGMDVEPFLQSDPLREVTRREMGFGPEDIVVGKIARLFHLKGHEYLIDAATEIVKANSHVKFLLVGDGILKDQLEQRIAQAGLTSHFHFTGLVAPSRIPACISAMDLLVHVSLREGLARTLPQALISAKPVVCFDVDGGREVCLDGETGFLIRAQDIASLSAAIVKLTNNAELRQRLGRRGRELFTEQFRHQHMTQQIRLLYEKTLAATARRAGE